MRLTQLTYRLKGNPEIYQKHFESWEEAMDFMEAQDIQKVVGKLVDVENAHLIYEAAAKNSKADWHEFSHVEVENG